MQGPSIHNGDMTITGNLSARTMSIPAGAIGDNQLAAGEAFDASKFTHRMEVHVKASQPDVAVAAFSDIPYLARAAATVLFGSVLVQVAATGADRTVTIDVQKGNQSDGYASILTAPLILDDGVNPREPNALTFDPAKNELSAEDSLRVVIAVDGASGNQAKGVDVFLTIDQTPQ